MDLADRRRPLKAALTLALAGATALGGSVLAQPTPTGAPSLKSGFRDPPPSAAPRVWWHWMNGNVTEKGIGEDIDWMSRMGIGGLQAFDASLSTPTIVPKRLVYMTPEWKHAFRQAAELADQKGLELGTAASPGWSETGGPWVKPHDAMKKLVWSETVVEGGRPFAGSLAPLPQVSGPYQDEPITTESKGLSGSSAPVPEFGADALVLAYRVKGEPTLPTPRMTTGDGKALDAALLTSGGYGRTVDVPGGASASPTVVLIDYETPQTVRSMTLHMPGAGGTYSPLKLKPSLEASDDGRTWRKVADMPVQSVPTTVSFAPVTSRYFRVVLRRMPDGGPVAEMMAGIPKGIDMLGMMSAFGGGATASLAAVQNSGLHIAQLSLSAEPRVNAFQLKAGFDVAPDYYAVDAQTGAKLDADAPAVAPSDVFDLTGKMTADGRLDWTPPPGRWKVIRFGYSLTGTLNHPATPEATGLEVDKYDGTAVHDYLETYLNMYTDATGPSLIGAHGLRAMVTDSIEVGASNWTPKMVEQFKRLRGYDPTPWMPALAGVVVGSRAQSDAFLYDYRRTLADLISSQHYAVLATVAHEHGLKYYSEALEDGRPLLGDDMAMRTHADVPMGALWTYGKTGPNPDYVYDMKGAASVAHIYGQNLVGTESLTSVLQPWAYGPSDLRPMMDLEFATGVNRPVIHTSVHQPVDDKQPGLALLIFGQYFNRHETWAEMARPWVQYMARSSYLLQQGHDVSDVGYFYGEEGPLTELYHTHGPVDAPVRYAYDFVNADALMSALQVQGSDLVTPGGARYRVLYLGGSSQEMTLPALRRIAALAEAGATIVGDAPKGSPSLNDDPAERARLIGRLWGGGATTKVGRGQVIAGHDVEAALASIGAHPDFSYAKSAPDSQILFAHRKLADGDIYFLSNRSAHPETGEARFRVAGKAPEIWRADTGKSQPVSYRIEGGETVVPLDMAALDSFFVVFRKPATAPSATVATRAWTQIADIGAGPWQVSFQPERGAPPSATLPALASLSDNADPEIKYFSGVATYTKSFVLPAGVRPGRPLMLDLGQFANVAEVRVNGQMVGTVWREPHRIDIGKAVKPGRNDLDIRVADLWVNRFIGDVQPGVKTKIAWAPMTPYRADAPLRPSGLIGPVTLMGDAK